MTERWQCRCGSGLGKRELLDAAGIFCTFVCDECEPERRKEFRLEIFDDRSAYARTGEERDLGGDLDEASEPVALIPITESEAKVLAQLLFNASTDTVVELTADVATSLLDKLRHAHYQEP